MEQSAHNLRASLFGRLSSLYLSGGFDLGRSNGILVLKNLNEKCFSLPALSVRV